MALSCGQTARVSLAALGGHAPEAQRLQLEEHLESCERCSAEHSAVLALVRGLDNAEHQTLTTAAREAIRRAVLTETPALGRAPPRPALRSRVPLRLSIAAVAVAAVVTVIVAVGGVGALHRRPYRVLGGDVTIAAAPEATDADPAESALTFRSVAGGRLGLTGAAVDLGRATEIVWNRHQRRLELRRGAVTVDVEHQPGRRFEVRTGRFTVDVVGTKFTVDAKGVHTERGVVRVLRPDGSIVERVEAGQTWTFEPPAGGRAKEEDVPAPAPAPASAKSSAPMGRAPMATPEARTRDRDGHLRSALDSTATLGGRLVEARRALSRGQASRARRMVAPLFKTNRDVSVEAHVLFAESFLIEGRYADAIDGYQLVARDFAGTGQAESAAFAIAQLTSEHGHRGEAVAALQAYLARYPKGRFAREAAVRLARLSGD